MIVGGLGLFVVFVIGYLFGSRPKPPASALTPRSGPISYPAQPKQTSPKQTSNEEVWMRKLLTITQGNKGAIERGMMARRRRFPRASRAEVLEMLYHDYLRDRS